MNEDLILEQGIETHDKLDEIITSSEHNIQATSDIVEELKDLNKTNENILVQNEDKFTELTNEIKQVTEAIKAIPESEPHPETVVISNLPEVQKVEITNLPKEKDDKQEFYSQLLHIAHEKNYNPHWASHKYREKFGVWPKGLESKTLPPTITTMKWLQSRNIAWAKRTQKRTV